MNLSSEQFTQIINSMKQPSAESGVAQKRRAARVEHRATVVITYCDFKVSPAHALLVAQGWQAKNGAQPSQRPSMTVMVRNLSSRGIGIMHPRKMNAGDQFIIRLSRQDGDPVSLLCSVAHCSRLHDNLFAVGAEFTCILPKAQEPQFSCSEELEAQRIRDSILT
jgi:hypothetical protein